MADKDSIRFLASQLMGLGDRARQDTQSAQSNAMQKRYAQLAEMKFGQEKQIQDQQTAVGALDQIAQSKAVSDMQMAKDNDPTHLALYVAKAKQEIYNQHPELQKQLPSALSGMKIPFYGNRPSPSGGVGAQPMTAIPQQPKSSFLSSLFSRPTVSTGNDSLDSLAKLYGGK